MTSRMWVAASALLLLGTALGAAQVVTVDDGWKAPAEARAKINPLAERTDAVAGGRKIFGQRCATCHGSDARGSKKGPDLTQPVTQTQTDGEIFWKISSGNTRAGMPGFSSLPPTQRWQLVLYLRSMP